RADENLHVQRDGHWSECYIPAFVRRYPYALAADGERFQVVLDEAWPGFNTEEGDPLFDSEGSESESLKRTLAFLEEYQGHVRTTQAFMGELNRLDLLESRQLQRAVSAGEEAQVLTGLWMINEDKLKALPADQAQALLKNGALGWIYAHLLSLVNLDRLNARLGQRIEAEKSAA
ncbi:SapC family protein, partial [mine drainage metagenome]